MTRRSAKEERLRKINACSLGTHEISAVCSKHFLDENYSVMFSDLAKIDFQRRLRKDGIGIILCLPNDPRTLYFDGK